MKRIISLLLIVVLVFSVTACAGTPQTEAGAISPEAGDHITGRELLVNKNARRALATGFDKDFIILDIKGDAGDIATDYFVPVNFSFGPEGSEFEGNDFRADSEKGEGYDPELASQYWAKAKEELGFETATISVLNFDSESSGKIMEHIKEEWQRNLPGLEVTIKAMPFAEKLKIAQAGDFDVNFAGWGPDYQDPMTFLDLWITDGSHNEGAWSNADYDKNIALAKDPATSEEDRWAAMIAAEQILLEEVPIINMYQRGATALTNVEVTNMYRHGFGADYSYKWVDKVANEDGVKVLNLVDTSDVPTMDPDVATDNVSFEMLNQTGEGLFRLGEGDSIQPGVAESYEFDDATNTYTFHLNPESKWVDSNGEVYGDVTAKDFVFGWDRLGSEDVSSQYAFMLEIAGIESYEAIDDHTLNVTVSGKTPYFKSILAFQVFQPVNQAFFESVGADKFGNSPETILNNGPFYMHKWSLSNDVQLLKNNHYWDKDVVMLDEVYTRIINGGDNNTLVQMYLDGECDRVRLSGENVATYRDRDDAETFGETTVYYLTLNVRGTEAE